MTLLGGGEENGSKKASVNSSCVTSSVRFSKGENSNSKINNNDDHDDDKVSNSSKIEKEMKKYSMLFASSEGFDNVRTSRENSIDFK